MRFPDADTFYCMVENNSKLLSLQFRKILTVENLSSLQWYIQVFQNSNLYLRAQILSLAVDSVNCFL